MDAELAPKKKHIETLNYMSVIIAAEISLVCATVLVFLVYFSLPIQVSTMVALMVIVSGSVICWKSIVAAEAVFMLSVLVAELIILSYFGILFWGFVIVDLFLMAWLSSLWNVNE